MIRLTYDFFKLDTSLVAKELLGKMMVIGVKNPQKLIITETESYSGEDPASHGARGLTVRNKSMFLEGGHLYVYLIYGMYFCLNIVTEEKNFPSAVLIRGAKLIGPEEKLIKGPGKLCRELKIDRSFDGIDICKSKNFALFDIGLKPEFKVTPRIGISKNKEAPLRFICEKI